MPYENHFAHQRYRAERPQVPWQLLNAPSSRERAEGARAALERAGQAFRESHVRAVYLVHGTFTGDDALGLLRGVGVGLPSVAAALRRAGKGAVDRVVGDVGNYTPAFATEFEHGIGLPVRLLPWSGENHHLGRAHAAICLIDELARMPWAAGDRVLLWGHSHAGNVFALMSNLLAAGAAVRDGFFQAARRFRGPEVSPVWARVREWLGAEPATGRLPQLDLVTFGTPIRYGWDSGGYARLLHFVYHRPRDGESPWRTGLPRSLDDIWHAADGDYIQQFGIAGTNLAPVIWSWGAFVADRKLGRLLQDERSWRSLWKAWKIGMRVPEEGETLLVDYGPMPGDFLQHLAGHAVYTRTAWLPFHAAQVAERWYAGGR